MAEGISPHMRVAASPTSHLDRWRGVCYVNYSHGDIAQLGERLDGIEKVRGSSPLISIKQVAEVALQRIERAGVMELRPFFVLLQNGRIST